MRKTDKGKVNYPKGTSAFDRRFARQFFVTVGEWLTWYLKSLGEKPFIIGCSGGIDSTVLVHAVTQWYTISSCQNKLVVCYVNHNLRDEEYLKLEEAHVRNITPAVANFEFLDIFPGKGSGLQERARTLRYDALSKIFSDGRAFILTGHTLSDVAETKLFQFVTGRTVTGIARHIPWTSSFNTEICRPMLDFTRDDVERYAKIFSLTWCEDQSNASDDYTRNKIRHHLIPLIKEHINPAFESIV